MPAGHDVDPLPLMAEYIRDERYIVAFRAGAYRAVFEKRPDELTRG